MEHSLISAENTWALFAIIAAIARITAEKTAAHTSVHAAAGDKLFPMLV